MESTIENTGTENPARDYSQYEPYANNEAASVLDAKGFQMIAPHEMGPTIDLENHIAVDNSKKNGGPADAQEPSKREKVEQAVYEMRISVDEEDVHYVHVNIAASILVWNTTRIIDNQVQSRWYNSVNVDSAILDAVEQITENIYPESK